MKSPPKQLQDDDAHDAVERFIEENSSDRVGAPTF